MLGIVEKEARKTARVLETAAADRCRGDYDALAKLVLLLLVLEHVGERDIIEALQLFRQNAARENLDAILIHRPVFMAGRHGTNKIASVQFPCFQTHVGRAACTRRGCLLAQFLRNGLPVLLTRDVRGVSRVLEDVVHEGSAAAKDLVDLEELLERGATEG